MKYKIVNIAALERRASQTDDPRHAYYVAMLRSSTFEQYVDRIHVRIPVFPKTYGDGKVGITPHAEFKYAMASRGWIAWDDAPPETEEHYRAILAQQVEHALNQSPTERKKRLAVAPKHPQRITVTTSVFLRNPYVVAEVLLRAAGKCESCGRDAPFRRKADDSPYLEVHHIVRLADNGSDSVENALALCPNCHRQRHFGIDVPET